MGPLDLSRKIKSEGVLTNNRVYAWSGIKRENTIKVEPEIGNSLNSFYIKCSTSMCDKKTINLTNGFQQKYVPSDFDIKSYDLFAAGLEPQMRKRRKRKLSACVAVPRRPTLPIAIRVHKQLINRDPSSLSKKELDSLTWAESIMVKTILRRSSITPTKDLPDKVPNPFREVPIKVQPKTECTFSKNLQLEIVDLGSPDRKYSAESGQLIQKAFNKVVVDNILRKSVSFTPKFGMTTWRDGVIVLDCKDENTFDFARVAVSNIVPWRRAILRAIPIENSALMYIAKFHAPDIDIKKKDVIKILQSQNPNIDMRDWKVVEERKSQFGFKTYYLSISKPPVAFFKNKYLKILFGATELALEFVENENTS